MKPASTALLVLILATACSSGHNATVAPTPTPTVTQAPTEDPQPTPTATVTPTPTPSKTVAQVAGPSGTVVPKGFTPQSATFISAKTGWVLGESACPTGTGMCDVIARTRDGGATWKAIPSPKTSPDQLGEIRFANETDGFVTGNQLWATHDGGQTWKVVPGEANVNELEAAAGRVWVVHGGLSSAPAAGGSFVKEAAPGAPVGLVLNGSNAYVGKDGSNTGYVGAHGKPFTALALPCTADDTGHELGVASSSDLLLICEGSAGAGQQEKTAYTSSNAGKTWLKRSAPPGLTGTTLGLTTDGYFLIDHQNVNVTRDGGKTWSVVLSSDGGITAGGFESATLGFAIGGFHDSTDQTMQLSKNGGRTWVQVAF